MADWQTDDRFVEIRSPWVTLIGEHLRDERGQLLDYWRVEKVDSAIVLPIQQEQLILCPPVYRPGVGQATVDFPGGRVPADQDPATAALQILQRELGITDSADIPLRPINPEAWIIDSSFSNQKLYGFVAALPPTIAIPASQIGSQYPITQAGIQELLQQLQCLQCRSLLLQWWLSQIS